MTSKIRNFQIQTRLGSGSYGVIFKAINKNNKQQCVMKQIRMNKLSQKNKKSTLMQATIMGKLNHPFIVQYQDSFIDNDTLHIVMEYCDNGDLSMFLKLQNKKSLKQQKIWKFFIQICMGLQYIHRNKILHRDIKTLNIFLNKNQDVKIGDLGVAKMLMSNDFAQTVVGTPYYLSPELCEQKPYNQKSDIWALGCLLYQLCTYNHPFEAANQASLILKIIRGKYSPIPEFYSKQLKDMIDLCLQRDYKRRPTANMILSRPKTKEYIKLFSLQDKVNQFYEKLKTNKQNKQIPIIQTNKLQIKKQLLQKKVVVPPKPQQKQQIKKVQPVNQIKKLQQEKDKKILFLQEKKPTISGMPEKNIILPDKNRIIQKLQPSNLEKNKYLNIVKPQQKQKKLKQNKQQFLKNLQNAIDLTPQRQNVLKQNPKNNEFDVLVNEQKSRLQKIDIKINQQLKKQKQSSKDIKNLYNEKKKTQFQEIPASPKRAANNPLTGERRSLPFMIKQAQTKSKQILPKQSDNALMPPLPPRNKEQVIRVKMDQPPIAPKVFDSNNPKSKCVIKSKGFSQQIVQSNHSYEKRSNASQLKNKQGQQKPILFGVDQEQKQRQGQQAPSTTQKQAFDNGLKGSQYHSEKNIKIISQSRAVNNNNCVFEKAKQSQHYVFKKKPKNSSNNSSSRIQKVSGSMLNQDLSRNAKNTSHYKQVTKQQQDLVMNLPDRPGNNYIDNSSDQQLKQPSQINMNKNFQLKDINNSIVLQKYEQILNSQSIYQSQQPTQKYIQHKIEQKFTRNQYPVRINKNLNHYNEQQENYHYTPQQKMDDNELDALLINSLPVKEQEIAQNASLALKTRFPQQNEDEIQDQSLQLIDSHSQESDKIQQQIYEVNKYNLQDEDEMKEDNNESFWNKQVKNNSQPTNQTQQWSFDEDPELPMLQQKQSPYFQQVNPYLVQEEQQSRISQKKNYLQIQLQQNIKRQDQINKLMQIKIQECKSLVPKHFDEILEFFRKKINMDDEYTQNDEKEIQDFLKKKGLTDQRKFQNIYKIMHFEMQLENTRTIIKRICKKLNELDED